MNKHNTKSSLNFTTSTDPAQPAGSTLGVCCLSSTLGLRASPEKDSLVEWDSATLSSSNIFTSYYIITEPTSREKNLANNFLHDWVTQGRSSQI